MTGGLTVATITAISFALFSIVAAISCARMTSWLVWVPHGGLGTIMLAALLAPSGSSLIWVAALVFFVGLVSVTSVIRLRRSTAKLPTSFGRFRRLLFGIDAGFMILVMTMMPAQAMNSLPIMSGELSADMVGHRALSLPSNLMLAVVIFTWAALSVLTISKLVASHPLGASWRSCFAEAASSGFMIISMTAMLL